MSRWVFLRHGESVANRERWLSGHVDTPLTDLGRQQAREAGARLAELPFSRAWCSDLRRARETAELALAGRAVPLEATPALRERFLGDWGRRSIDDMRAAGGMAVLIRWEGRPPGGESQADLAARLLPWFASQPDDPAPRLVAAHGGVIRVLLGLIDGMDVDEIGKHRVANAQPIERTVTAARWGALAAERGDPAAWARARSWPPPTP